VSPALLAGGGGGAVCHRAAYKLVFPTFRGLPGLGRLGALLAVLGWQPDRVLATRARWASSDREILHVRLC